MQVNSTGLGKTVLTCQFESLEPLPDTPGALKMAVEATHPVHWKIGIVMDGADLRQLLPIILRPAMIWFIVKMLTKGQEVKLEFQPDRQRR